MDVRSCGWCLAHYPKFPGGLSALEEILGVFCDEFDFGYSPLFMSMTDARVFLVSCIGKIGGRMASVLLGLVSFSNST